MAVLLVEAGRGGSRLLEVPGTGTVVAPIAPLRVGYLSSGRCTPDPTRWLRPGHLLAEGEDGMGRMGWGRAEKGTTICV